MTPAKAAILVYALANIGMGLHGGLGPAQSPESLMGGVGAGVILLIAFALTMKLKTPRAGYITALVIAVALLGRFTPDLIELQKPYPHGVQVLLGVAVIVILLGGHLATMKAKKAAEPDSD
jgi:uncharacterized membrane protein (UPF0136 family)